MNLKLLALLAIVPVGSTFGASYNIDFNSSPYVVDEGVDGVDGWIQNVSNDDAIYPLTWIGLTDAGGQGLAIGGYYDDNPNGMPTSARTGAPVTLSRTFTSLSSSFKTLSFQAAIIDSTTDFAAGDRDTFGFQVLGAEGQSLLTISLVPVDPDQVDPEGTVGEWAVYYAFGDDALQSTGNAIQEADVGIGGFYKFMLELNPNGLVFRYGAGDTTTYSEFGNPGDYDFTDTELTFVTSWAAGDNDTTGDNYVIIDNLVVPEPSSLLLGGLSVLGLVARRRRL